MIDDINHNNQSQNKIHQMDNIYNNNLNPSSNIHKISSQINSQMITNPLPNYAHAQDNNPMNAFK